MITKLVAIGVGAAGGAWLRWGLGVALNAVLPNIPLGTFVANMTGGFLIGLTVEFFSQHVQLPPEWKLFFITGFLGALTTFSSFSAEAVHLLQTGRAGWMLLLIGMHVIGSILMTIIGMYCFRTFFGA